MALFKIWRAKHKKLSEDLITQTMVLKIDENDKIKQNDTMHRIEECTDQDISFKLKYIGSTTLHSTIEEYNCPEALKSTLKLLERNKGKAVTVVMLISPNFVRVTDLKRNEMIQTPILKISNCCLDSTNKEVFSFIVTDDFGNKIFHAFSCQKRKIAEQVTLAISHIFSDAYENFVKTQRAKDFLGKEEEKFDENLQDCNTNINEEDAENRLIDLDHPFENDEVFEISRSCTDGCTENSATWVSFEQ